MNELINHKSLSEALFAAKQELGTSIENDSEGQHGPYATLGKVLASIEPVAQKHGILLIQRPTLEAGQPCLETTLQLVTGSDEEIIATHALHPDRPGPQSLGAAETYARRRTLLALFGIASEGDPDAAQSAPARSQHKGGARGPTPGQKPTSGALSHKPKGAGHDLRDTVISFGKFKNTRIGDHDLADLVNYAQWLDSNSREQNKPMKGAALEFFNIVTALQAEVEQPEFAPPSDEIPF